MNRGESGKFGLMSQSPLLILYHQALKHQAKFKQNKADEGNNYKDRSKQESDTQS